MFVCLFVFLLYFFLIVFLFLYCKPTWESGKVGGWIRNTKNSFPFCSSLPLIHLSHDITKSRNFTVINSFSPDQTQVSWKSINYNYCNKTFPAFSTFRRKSGMQILNYGCFKLTGFLLLHEGTITFSTSTNKRRKLRHITFYWSMSFQWAWHNINCRRWIKRYIE